jgi:glycerol kinase
VWADLNAVAATWALGAAFIPKMAPSRRTEALAGWRTALRRTLLQ